MNRAQKTLVSGWIISLILLIAIVIIMITFDNPHPVVALIPTIIILIVGKSYKELRDMRKESDDEITEYAGTRKGLLIALALYAVILPFITYMLVIKDYIKITMDYKEIFLLGCILGIPILLFDIGNKIYTYKKRKDIT